MELAGQGNGCLPGESDWLGIQQSPGPPMPANGATVTSMYAETNAVLAGTETALVAVIDNTTGVMPLGCTVNSTTKSSCSNTSGSGSAAGGDKIQVKVTAPSTSLQQGVGGEIPLLAMPRSTAQKLKGTERAP